MKQDEEQFLSELKNLTPRAPSLEEHYKAQAAGADPLEDLYASPSLPLTSEYCLDTSTYSQEELLGKFYS